MFMYHVHLDQLDVMGITGTFCTPVAQHLRENLCRKEGIYISLNGVKGNTGASTVRARGSLVLVTNLFSLLKLKARTHDRIL